MLDIFFQCELPINSHNLILVLKCIFWHDARLFSHWCFTCCTCWGLIPDLCGRKQLQTFCPSSWRCRLDDIIQHYPTFSTGSAATSPCSWRRHRDASTFRPDRKLHNTSSPTRNWGIDKCHGFTGYIYALQGLFLSTHLCCVCRSYVTPCSRHIEILFCLQGIKHFTWACDAATRGLDAKSIMKEKDEVEEEGGGPQDGVKLKVKCSLKSDKITSTKRLLNRSIN